jgi:hypothetical protein
MTIPILLTAVLIFSLLSLLLVFGVFVLMLNLKNQVSQIYTAMATTVNKLLSIEILTGKMANSFAEYVDVASELVERNRDTMMGDSHQAIYRTLDGKYTASSLEQLLNNIKKDGNADKYLSDDMENLRKLFESDDNGDGDEDGEE